MKQVLEQKIARFEKNPRVMVIENWADLDIVSPMESEIHHDCLVLEYAGNIGRVQGLQPLLGLLKKSVNKKLAFHIWGTGAEENNLKDYVQKNEMQNVTFHGAYLRSMQKEVLNSCDLALVTLNEGMFGLGVPSKTYNIMAAGKAILYIGEQESEIGLLVKEKQIGFVFEPSDKNGIVKFLSELSIDKRKELAVMGNRALRVAEQEYAKEVILKKFTEAI